MIWRGTVPSFQQPRPFGGGVPVVPNTAPRRSRPDAPNTSGSRVGRGWRSASSRAGDSSGASTRVVIRSGPNDGSIICVGANDGKIRRSSVVSAPASSWRALARNVRPCVPPSRSR